MLPATLPMAPHGCLGAGQAAVQLVEPIHLRGQGFRRAFVVDHIVGGGQAFAALGLPGHDGLDLALGKAVARHDPGNLRGLAAIHHQHPVHPRAP